MITKFKPFLFVIIMIFLPACTGIQTPANREPPTRTAVTYASSYPVLMPSPTAISTPSPRPTFLETEPESSELRITKLQMYDSKLGWALHTAQFSQEKIDAKLLRTEDGGQTWKNVSPSIPEGYGNLPEVAFLNVNEALAVYARSFMPASPESEITIWHTGDAGNTWDKSTPILLNQAPMLVIDQVELLDQSDGWMLATGDTVMGRSSITMFVTKDSGMNWNIVYNTNEHSQNNDLDALWALSNYPYGERKITFISPSTGYYSNGELFLSQDGGFSWQKKALPDPPELPGLDTQISQSVLFSYVSLPQFFSSQDGVLIRRIFSRNQVIIPPGNYSGFPQEEFLYFSNDGGQIWSSTQSPAKIGSVHFLDVQTGWYLGKNDIDPNTPTQLYQTTDGRKTWFLVDAESPLPLGSEIQFINETDGFAFIPPWAGYAYGSMDERSNLAGDIFRTFDGGKTWEQFTPSLVP